jgi:hypothetical protein
MIPIIMNENFERLGMIKRYTSFLWHKCYYKCGDFEITMSTAEHNYDLIQVGRYVARDDDDRIGVIEKVVVTFDIDTGETATISGRFIEKILGQRIVWDQTSVNGTVENGIYAILYANIINPSDADRKIDSFELKAPKHFADRLEAQYTGTNILSLTEEVCQALSIGFKVALQNGKLVFELYKGTDRSYGQKDNTWVVFSDVNGIMTDMSYRYAIDGETNVARVAGEGEGKDRKVSTVGSSSGLERKELFVDAKDIQSNGGEITDAEYINLLNQRGAEKLTMPVQEVDSAVRLTNKYVYKKDFDLGDIVSIENTEWGISMNKRIVEVLESQELGYSVIVTFGGE